MMKGRAEGENLLNSFRCSCNMPMRDLLFIKIKSWQKESILEAFPFLKAAL